MLIQEFMTRYDISVIVVVIVIVDTTEGPVLLVGTVGRSKSNLRIISAPTSERLLNYFAAWDARLLNCPELVGGGKFDL